MISLWRHRTFQIFFLLFFYLLLAAQLPLPIHQFLYSVSLCIKDVLIWMLPITVFAFISSSIASFEKRAPIFLFSLLLFEALSNGLCTWYAYGWAHIGSYLTLAIHPVDIQDTFQPLWRLSLTQPNWWSADKGVFLGMLIGLIGALTRKNHTLTLLRRGAEFLLTRIFAKLIPLYLLGFFARMYQVNLLTQMGSSYVAPLIWLIIAIFTYLALLFVFGSRKSGPSLLDRMKNLASPGAIAFSSGCSLSTMPWTIQGTEKNLQHPNLAKMLIPMTTNIQQVGDCITNCFLCALIYLQFYHSLPSIEMWLLFSTIFTLARFATAAVMGGAIFMMLPIYETYLHFNQEMIALILAFNVILDPLVTSTNVIGNGALSTLFERLWLLISKTKKIPEHDHFSPQ